MALLVEAERDTCHSSSRPKGTLGSISVAEPSVATSARTTPDGTAVTASLILAASYPPLTPASPPPYPLRARHGEARKNYGEDREKVRRKWKSLKLKSEIIEVSLSCCLEVSSQITRSAGISKMKPPRGEERKDLLDLQDFAKREKKVES